MTPKYKTPDPSPRARPFLLLLNLFLLVPVLFNMHDTDNDGTITLEEYRKVRDR